MKHLQLLLIAVLFIACKTEKKEDTKTTTPKAALTILEKVAKAHGIDNWNNVNQITFTFNVDRGENHFERVWKWQPKKSIVTLNDTIEYTRSSKIDSTYIRADQGFINDKYWLLAPFNLVWDKNITHTHTENQTAPISNKNMHKLTIVYSNEGGYTPGDAYDFYFEDDYIVKEWVFRKANTSEPSMMTTWEDYIDVNGLQIAKTHKNKEGNFTLYFSNISVN